MKKTTLIILLLPFIGIAQKNDLIKYLDAYKSKEFSESRKIIADYSFGQDAEYTMSAYSDVSGITFKVKGLEKDGYKAIVNCKLQNKAGSFVEKRMLAVLYFDKLKGHWAVFGFRETCDPIEEYSISKGNIDKGEFYTTKQHVYRNAAYWALMSGEITSAEDFDKKAYLEAEKAGDMNFSTKSKAVLAAIK